MNEAQKLKRLRFFAVGTSIVSALLFFSALLLEQRDVQKSDLQQTARSAETKLRALKTEVISVADSIMLIDQKDGLLNFLTQKNLSSTGITVLVYDNAELVAWSGSGATFASMEKLLNEEKMLVHLPNGWYEMVVRENNSRTVVALILIYTDYAYQNKYLVNEFNSALDISLGIEITEKDAVAFVRNGDGKSLFGIKESASTLALAEKFPLAETFDMLAFLFLLAGCVCAGRILLHRSAFLTLTFVLLLVALRMTMIFFHVPDALYNTPLFSPSYYASSLFSGSLGDLFLNSALALSIALIFFRHEKLLLFYSSLSPSKSKSIYFYVQWIALIMLFAVVVNYYVAGLIVNSNISFSFANIFELPGFSILGVVIIALAMGLYFLVLRGAADAIQHSPFSNDIKIRYLVFSIGLTVIAVCAGVFSFPMLATFTVSDFSMLFLLGILAEVFFIRKKFSQFQSVVLLLLVFSGYTSALLSTFPLMREAENLKMIAQKIEAEQDLVAEHLFSDVQSRLQEDSVIKRMAVGRRGDLIAQRMQQSYFNGYWGRYDTHIFCYDSIGHLISSSSDSLPSDFFERVIRDNAKLTLSNNLFFTGSSGEKFSYIAKVFINDTLSAAPGTSIVILLSEKFLQGESGFPELFLSGSEQQNGGDENYSYARYRHGKLNSSSGNYSYPLTANAFSAAKEDFSSVKDGSHEHIVYRSSKSSLVVISRPRTTALDVLTLFSYITAIFSLLFIIISYAAKLLLPDKNRRSSLKQRIRFAIMFLVVISFILTGWGTVRFITGKYDAEIDEGISSKISAVLKAMNNELPEQNMLDNILSDEKTSLLLRLSSSLSADFNLYDLSGRLIFSSQPKLYQQGIISDRMNPVALFETSVNGKTKFVHDESIGRLNYIAAYQPVRNRSNKTEGYIGLPYFEKQAELKKEISSFIGSLMNLYILLLALALMAAYFISSRITTPLQELQEKFSTVRLGKQSQSIDWKRNDEIGSLVLEYNRMVEELAMSAEMLARSERESAWREMAKQVAHEIKNPLTPMKLSIQHLQRAIQEGSPEANSLTEKISGTLIEQIDALSAIATAFSSFAKMPQAEKQNVTLDEILLSVISLYKETSSSEFLFSVSKENVSIVSGGRDELFRLFSNLLKNALQSIPETRRGKVEIKIQKEIHRCIVSVTDNGTGIPEEARQKIFSPNFTTKTTGMGLGLALVRSIAESNGGRVWFESRTGEGTTFFVELPLVS